MKSRWTALLVGGLACAGCASVVLVGGIGCAWYYFTIYKKDAFTRHIRTFDRYYALRQNQNAMREANAALAIYPESGAALERRARIYQRYHDYGHALADYDHAVVQALDSSHMALIYTDRASCRLAMRQPDRAIADCESAERASRPTAYTCYTLGSAYRQKHDLKHAYADLTRSLELGPKYTWALSLRALTSAESGNYQAATDDQGRLLALRPQDAQVLGNMGWYQYQFGDVKAAETSTRKALDLQPDLGFARFNLGLCLAVEGRQVEADSEYSRGVVTAIKLRQRDRIAAGIQDLRDALRKHPDSQSVRTCLAKLEQATREGAQR